MTVVQHLTELRRRLVISLAAVGVGSIAGFVFFDRILTVVTDPYRNALLALPESARPAGTLTTGDLVYSSPVDPLATFIKVGIFTGFLIALPVLLWQVWQFITPGLTSRERRLAIPFVLVSVLLFAGGTVFAFFIIPRGLRFLFSFGGDNLVPVLFVDRYLGFLIVFILAFGLSFELPLAMLFLTGAGVLTIGQLRRWRRYVYFGLIVFAAVITPTGDPFTLMAMWIPLVLLYEGAILTARLIKR